MIPVLYESTEAVYGDNGFGLIADAASCTVTEEANGSYELALTLPAASKRYADLAVGRQILAKPNQLDQDQPFRIYRITRPIKGLVTVNARHISYDLSGVPVGTFTLTGTAGTALGAIASHALTANPFVFTTDVVTTGTFSCEQPCSVRKLMGPADQEGTLLQVFGGDLYFNRLAVQLLEQRGVDRGFRVVHGVNMTDLRADENGGEIASGVLPFWTDGTTVVTGDPQYAAGSGISWPSVRTVDLSSEFAVQPGKAELNAHGAAYVTRNHVGVPKANFTVKFVPPGARGLQAPELLGLFDPVTVRYEALGIEVRKNVVKTTYDVLRERYTEIEIGDRAVYIAETIAAPVKNIARGAVGGGALSKSVKADIKDAKDTADDAKDKANDAMGAANDASSLAGTAWAYADANKDRFLGDLNAIVSALNANTTYSGFRASIKDKPM